MKIILFLLLGSLSFSASAQWYKLNLHLKKHERPSIILEASDHSIERLPVFTIYKPKIHSIQLDRSDYSYEVAEAGIMKTAQHNMRFRVYADASYNFSDLASLYVCQNRFSEAKWYLLQSNIISRQQNDDKHTVANLISLALIKANIGDYELAQQDLSEARDISSQNGYDLKIIEKQMLYIKQNRGTFPKPELRYAEAAQSTAKSE